MDENLEFVEFKFEDVSFQTTLTKKFNARKPYAPNDPRKVTAFIPGTIIKVLVKDGAKVKKGEGLIILQAMKMNNQLTAYKNGVIKKVYVKQGEVVPKNHLLLEFK